MTPPPNRQLDPGTRTPATWLRDAVHNYVLPLLILAAIAQGKPRRDWPQWRDLWA